MLPPLLISVPSVELNRVELDGSVFDARRLLSAPFSLSLQRALQIVLDNFGAKHRAVLCVARPEIFTHGEPLAWLTERIDGAEQHLCLSNGQTLKLVPGLRNDVFVYGLHRATAARQYRELLRRAPELLSRFTTQYNTAHEGQTADAPPSPESAPLLPMRPFPSQGLDWYYPFYLNRHSLIDSSDRMLQWATNTLPTAETLSRVVVIDCNDSALEDAYFCRTLAQRIAHAVSDPGVGLLLLLPDFEDPAAETVERLHRVLDGVLRGGVPVPRVRMDNVLLCTGLAEQELTGLGILIEFVVHESTPMWHYTPPIYETAEAVRLYLARRSLAVRAKLASLHRAWLGREPGRHSWPSEFTARYGFEVS